MLLPLHCGTIVSQDVFRINVSSRPFLCSEGEKGGGVSPQGIRQFSCVDLTQGR